MSRRAKPCYNSDYPLNLTRLDFHEFSPSGLNFNLEFFGLQMPHVKRKLPHVELLLLARWMKILVFLQRTLQNNMSASVLAKASTGLDSLFFLLLRLSLSVRR